MPQTTTCLSQDTLLKYINGELSPAENYRVEKHFSGCVLCSAAIDGLMEMQDKSGLHEIFDGLRKEIDHRTEEKKKKPVIISFPQTLWKQKGYRYAAAASVIILCGIGFFFSKYFKTTDKEKYISDQVAPESGVKPAEFPSGTSSPASNEQLNQQDNRNAEQDNSESRHSSLGGKAGDDAGKKSGKTASEKNLEEKKLLRETAEAPAKQGSGTKVEEKAYYQTVTATGSSGLETRDKIADIPAEKAAAPAAQVPVLTPPPAPDINKGEKAFDETIALKQNAGAVAEEETGSETVKKSEAGKNRQKSSAGPERGLAAGKIAATSSRKEQSDFAMDAAGNYTRSTGDLLHEAIEKYNGKRYDEALKILEEDVFKQGGGNSDSSGNYRRDEARYYAGMAAYNLRNYSKALGYFNALAGEKSGKYFEDAQWHSAQCYIQLNEKAKAKILLDDLSGSEGKYKQQAAEELKSLE